MLAGRMQALISSSVNTGYNTSVEKSLVGSRIRDYDILEIIGRGRIGTLYLARHTYLEVERAIKVIHSGIASSPNQLERILRECKILVKVRHPNLAELYDFGELPDGMFFLVLELVRGENLQELINRVGKIPVKEAVAIIREAAQGLQSAHDRGIIHRDICPENLRIVKGNSGVDITKVVDFGTARPTPEETRTLTLQNATEFLGRPKFTSPEEFGLLKEGETIDQRSDIYSLAVTLYYMISGEFPYDSPVPHGTPTPFHFPLAIPATLEKVILRDLSRDREDRHASLTEMIRDLDAASSEELDTVVVTPDRKGQKFYQGYLFAGRYVIDKRLGKGGMGSVYKATDKILDVPVAVKTLNPELSQSEQALARFKREVILARKVAHPNVCRIYDIGENEGVHYVSMEYLAGITLADMLLTKGAFPIETGLAILRQILTALQEAHRAGVIHRDLKPQNIMVDQDQRACIMDFGISVSQEVSRLTATGMMIGTPRYMAPEQFGEGQADQRTDIYSAAVIMFEMFTGRLPFEANTPASAMYAHVNLQPVKPTEIAPWIPRNLEFIMLKALEKNPDNRFQSVQELLKALDAVDRPQPAPIIPAKTEESLEAEESFVEEVEPEPAFPFGKLVLVLLFFAMVGAGGWWYLRNGSLSSKAEEQPKQSNVQLGARQNQAAPKPTITPVPVKPKPEESAPPEVTQEPVQEVALEPVPDSVKEPVPDTIEEPAPQEPVKPVEPPAKHVPPQPGQIVYEGPYPVLIYNGNKLLIDTAAQTSLELPAATYSLTLVSTTNAIIRITQPAEVKSGEVTTILAPPMAKLTVSANPSNCKIYIDTIDVGFAPIHDFPIQAGNHHIRIAWEVLQKEKSGFFTVATDETKTIRAKAEGATPEIFEQTNNP